MTTLVICVCAALLGAMWWLVIAGRRRTRRDLLSHGVRVGASASFVSGTGRGAGAIVASYFDNRGHLRTVAKTPARARDRRLPVQSAVIIFDARWPGRDDRMLLGFGDEPALWHRVEFHEGSPRRARTHV